VAITTIGIDLAKDVFELHGVDGKGRVVLQRRLTRKRVIECMAKLPACLVGMEARGSAHYRAREIGKLGHRVRLMSPRFTRAYVKGNKNDANAAAAIREAVSRPSMRFVPIKNQQRRDIAAPHRVRAQLSKNRTALTNQMRGL
jgi:transposase